MPYANPQKAREWLDANRESILQQKRQRYAAGPMHAAEKVAERSRDTMKRNRKHATLHSFLFKPRLMDANNPWLPSIHCCFLNATIRQTCRACQKLGDMRRVYAMSSKHGWIHGWKPRSL